MNRRPTARALVTLLMAAVVPLVLRTQGFAGAAVPDPQFDAPRLYNVRAHVEAVITGDFTGDGREDVVASTTFAEYGHPDAAYRLALLRGRADGGLDEPIRLFSDLADKDQIWAGLAAADFDQDGFTDVALATAAGVDLYLQRNGTLAERTLLGPVGARQVETGDINRDGRADLIVNGSAGVSWMAGTGDGTFGAPVVVSPGYMEIEVDDVTGDGLLDVAAARFENNPTFTSFVRVIAQTADGGFAPPVDYPAPGSDGRLATGDITGDGRIDVVHSGPDSRIAVHRQGPQGSLEPLVLYPSYAFPRPVEIADVNGDGRRDVITFHDGWERAGVHVQESDGTLSDVRLFQAPYANILNPKGLTADDVTSDGLVDMVLGAEGTIVIFPGLPPRPPTTTTSTTAPTSTTTTPTTVPPGPQSVLISAHSGKVMHAPPSPTTGAQLMQWGWTGMASQRWRMVALGGDLHAVVSVGTNNVLDTAGATTNGAAVVQARWTGAVSQWWRLVPMAYAVPVGGPQVYLLISAQSGKVLDVAGAAKGDGAPVIQWTWHGGANQIWIGLDL
jgi:hypothetical protein